MIGLLTSLKVTPETVALTWKLVVAVAGALTLKVNEVPIASDESAVNPTPTFELGVKSESNPDVEEDPLIAVIVQLIRSPTRTTANGVVHERTEAVVGLPYTVNEMGLVVNAFPEHVELTWKLVVYAVGAFRLNVNAAPPLTEVNTDVATPALFEAPKSDNKPVVAEDPLMEVIVQETRSPIRTMVAGVVQASDDSVVGRP